MNKKSFSINKVFSDSRDQYLNNIWKFLFISLVALIFLSVFLLILFLAFLFIPEGSFLIFLPLGLLLRFLEGSGFYLFIAIVSAVLTWPFLILTDMNLYKQLAEQEYREEDNNILETELVDGAIPEIIS